MYHACIYGNYSACRNPIYDDILQVYDAPATHLLSGEPRAGYCSLKVVNTEKVKFVSVIQLRVPQHFSLNGQTDLPVFEQSPVKQ